MRLQAQLRSVFEEAGFVTLDLHVHERTIENRKRGDRMPRRWIQGAFALPPGPDPALCRLSPTSAAHGARASSCKSATLASEPHGSEGRARDGLSGGLDEVEWWTQLPWQACSVPETHNATAELQYQVLSTATPSQCVACVTTWYHKCK